MIDYTSWDFFMFVSCLKLCSTSKFGRLFANFLQILKEETSVRFCEQVFKHIKAINHSKPTG